MQRLANRAWPMVGLFVLLLVSLFLLADFAGDVEQFGRLYVPLLLLNALGIAFITVLIGINAWSLIRQFRQRVAGSRLTARLVGMFVLLALVPVTIVYSFSVQFIRSGVDSWFDVEVEQALDDALELSTVSLDMQTDALARSTQRLATELDPDQARADLRARLDELRSEVDASRLALYSGLNWMTASSRRERGGRLDERLAGEIMQQVRAGETYAGLDPKRGDTLHVRVVVPLPSAAADDGPVMLEALYPVPGRIDALAGRVQAAVGTHRELVFLREPLKTSYVLTLSLVLLLSVLTAVWAAFYFARRLMLPVHSLAEGTRAVAAGNYSTRLPPSGRDELGFVVRSFNEMTRRLGEARDQARISRLQVESQRAYLEAVLERISTGVMTVDTEQRLQTANAAASAILNLSLAPRTGRPLESIAGEHPPFGQFIQVILPHLERDEGEWREEFELPGSSGRHYHRQIIVCRGARLPDRQDVAGGWVIVFDDVSAMVRAQREAAWAEVARRLAHEIKNPLTPIQLSAERLRHKFLADLPGADADVLDRSTRTIIEQVEALKGMVRAFADYAATPAADFTAVDLNALCSEVVEMYNDPVRHCRVEFTAASELPEVHADRARLRQVLHNLIKNAIEAQSARDERIVQLHTRAPAAAGPGRVELQVCDGGPGIGPELLDRLFEPYTTGNKRGSGLGLAIVKKIVEEHGGEVGADNVPDGGACVTLRLPVRGDVAGEAATSADSSGDDSPDSPA